MGIKGFLTWIYANNPSCIKQTVKIDCLLIDLNFLLYYHSGGLITLKKLIRNIKMHIYFMIEKMEVNHVIIVLDGVPPKAKEKTRKKRIKNMLKKEIDTHFVNPMDFSTNLLLMENIKKNFIKFSKKIPKIIGSSALTLFGNKDESELKIAKFINNSNYKSFCIVSNDADTILLSIMHEKKIYIFNLKPFRKIISIKKLIKSLESIFMNNDNLRDDFCLISIMMGNDYIPKLKLVNEKSLIETYKQFSVLNLPIFKDLKIIIKNFILFLNFLISNMNFFNKVDCNDINYDNAKIYMDGISWCLRSYKQTTCVNNNFVCDINPQHPLNILLYCNSLHDDNY
jgi:hypothetical protein